MADLDDRLNRLISDPQSVKKVLETARTIMAQRDGTEQESADNGTQSAEKHPDENQTPDSSTLLTMLAQEPHTDTSTQESSSQEHGNGASLLDILPELIAGFSGTGNLIKRERLDLLNAMRPYLKEERVGNIDRAMRMANATKAAMHAMHRLGR